MNQVSIEFHGRTFDARFDYSRLARQAASVFDLMRDGGWRSLREISQHTNAPEASVSARLRDFRKLGLEVDRRRRGNEFGGVWEYRINFEERGG